MEESSEKLVEVDLDAIAEKAGTFGKYQIVTYILLMFPVFFTSAHSTNYVFTAPDTEYRCKSICDVENVEFKPHWLENAIPENSKCLIFKGNRSEPEFLHKIDNSTCPEGWFDREEEIYCNEYVYKYENTFVEEMKIPCENWKRALVGTLHSIGNLINLPLIGYLSDKFGRRMAIVVTCLSEGILGVIKGFSLNYEMFTTLELFESGIGSGIFTSSFIIGLEILVPAHRVLGSTFINIYYGLGQVLLGLLAWAFPYWRTLIFVLYVPIILFGAYHFIILESFRWLYSKGKYREVIDTFKKIAKMNGKELSEETLKPLYSAIENNVKVESKPKETLPYAKIVRSKVIMIRLLKCCIWWVTCAFCFFGLTLNAVTLGGNPYVNYIYSSLMEVPAHTLAYFTLDRIGRKWTLFCSFVITGVCMFSFAFVSEGLQWLSLTSYFVGKLFIILAFNAVYLYTSELFPTTLRHSLFAFCSMIGRIGTIMAQFTPILGEYIESLPAILFGSTCVISALLVLTSPETLNLRLPETIEEAEDIDNLKIRR